MTPVGFVFGAWEAHAACRRVPRAERQRLFFPEPFSDQETKVVGQAKAICAACPVRVDCLRAVTADEEERSEGEDVIWRHGIAGGLLARERDQVHAAQHQRSA